MGMTCSMEGVKRIWRVVVMCILMDLILFYRVMALVYGNHPMGVSVDILCEPMVAACIDHDLSD